LIVPLYSNIHFLEHFVDIIAEILIVFQLMVFDFPD